jgi:hypothetical protein
MGYAAIGTDENFASDGMRLIKNVGTGWNHYRDGGIRYGFGEFLRLLDRNQTRAPGVDLHAGRNLPT